MLHDDIFNAIPATAACIDCKHMVPDPKTGRPWCEWLGKYVSLYGWCEDYELKPTEAIKRKTVEKS